MSPSPLVRHRFLAAFLVLLAAFLLRLRLGPVFGWQPEFVLASLITFAFILGFFELGFLIACALFLLSWQPGLSIEFALMALLPLACFLFRKIVYTFEGWFSNFLTVFLGVIVFNLSIDAALALHAPPVLLGNAVASAFFGFLIFSVFGYCYQDVA